MKPARFWHVERQRRARLLHDPEQHPGHRRRSRRPATSTVWAPRCTACSPAVRRWSELKRRCCSTICRWETSQAARSEPQGVASARGDLSEALKSHPAERYPTARDLANDLEAFLADERVSVYREGMYERLARGQTQPQLGDLRHAGHRACVARVVRGRHVAWLYRAAKTRARKDAEIARKEAEAARETAEFAQKNGMRLAAGFAAKAVAGEIDLRWRTLTQDAADPALPPLIEAMSEKRSARRSSAACKNGSKLAAKHIPPKPTVGSSPTPRACSSRGPHSARNRSSKTFPTHVLSRRTIEPASRSTGAEREPISTPHSVFRLS